MDDEEAVTLAEEQEPTAGGHDQGPAKSQSYLPFCHRFILAPPCRALLRGFFLSIT